MKAPSGKHRPRGPRRREGRRGGENGGWVDEEQIETWKDEEQVEVEGALEVGGTCSVSSRSRRPAASAGTV